MTASRNLSDHATPIRPLKLAHVVLRTSTLDQSRDWYNQVLMGRTVFENGMVCFLTYDDEHHRIGLINRPDLSGSADDRLGLEHIAFTYESLGDLLSTYKRLSAQNIHPYWTINHGPTISFYYKDPSGNRVELQFDVFDNPADVDAFFEQGGFEENFIGIRVNPEDMISSFEAGVPLEQILARPRLPSGTTPWDMFTP
jgi:catechol 2,3-dioxygenase-like lactoylglutathione lyase family enzyme